MPTFPFTHFPYRSSADAVLLSERCTRLVRVGYLLRRLARKLRSIVFFTSVSLPDSLSFLPIGCIINKRTPPQVTGVNTDRIVAAMQRAVIGFWNVRKKKSYAAGNLIPAFIPKNSVKKSLRATRGPQPWPALIGLANFHFVPKSFGGGRVHNGVTMPFYNDWRKGIFQ